jgi:hypothetical protein
MYQRDYILRVIEMLAEVIARILALILKKDFNEASVILETAYRDFLKEDSSFFKQIPREQITDVLLHEHNYTQDHLKILAELFNAEAELLSANNKKEESTEYYEKALILFEFVEQNSTDYAIELINKIKALKEKIS